MVVGAVAFAAPPLQAAQAVQIVQALVEEQAGVPSLQTRVAALRAALAAVPEATLAATQTPNWTNWPKWSKWSNWANK